MFSLVVMYPRLMLFFRLVVKVFCVTSSPSVVFGFGCSPSRLRVCTSAMFSSVGLILVLIAFLVIRQLFLRLRDGSLQVSRFSVHSPNPVLFSSRISIISAMVVSCVKLALWFIVRMRDAARFSGVSKRVLCGSGVFRYKIAAGHPDGAVPHEVLYVSRSLLMYVPIVSNSVVFVGM